MAILESGAEVQGKLAKAAVPVPEKAPALAGKYIPRRISRHV